MKNRALIAICTAVVLALLAYVVLRDDGDSTKKTPKTSASSSESMKESAAEYAATDSEASKPALVRGRVATSEGAPISNATISIVRADGEETELSAHDAVIHSDEEGNFAYDAIPPGEYAITASAADRLPKTQRVSLAPGESRDELVLMLEAGGFSLSGAVHDATGGTVPGAVVQAMPIGGGDGAASATLASPEGTYAMSLPNGHYIVWAYHADYVPHSQMIEVSSGALVLDFQLAPGAVVEGTVRHTGDGSPVGGAIVSYATERKSTMLSWRGTSGSGTTIADRNGAFRITGLRSGSLRLSAHGGNATTTEPTRIALGIAEHRSEVELFVDDAHRVSGRVVDASTKKPVGGMNVALAAAGGERVASSAKTAEDGTFVITSVPEGDYRARAMGKHYMLDMFGKPVSVEGDTIMGDIEVSPGAMVHGRVEPASEANISIDLRSLEGISPGSLAQARSNSDGSFEIGPFSPSQFKLQARTDDGRIGKTEVEVPEAGVRDVVIQVEGAAGLEGTVVDADGKPVSGVRVSLRRDPKGESFRVVVNGVDRTAETAITSPDGSFLIQGLEGGDYQLQVLDEETHALAWAGSTDSAPKNIQIAPETVRTGELLKVESRNARIWGQVLGPNGSPAPDTWVSASLHRHEDLQGPMPGPRAAENSDGNEEDVVESRSEVSVVMLSSNDSGTGSAPGIDLSRSGEVPPVLTDSEGRFEISGLRQGRYDLIAEGLGGTARAIVTGTKTDEEVRIRMVPLTRIEGRVTQDGEPVTRYTVELGGSGYARKQVRNDDGTFTFHRLDPGPYSLTVRSTEGEAEASIDVVAGKTATIEIPLESLVEVVGTIVDEAGNPMAGVLTIPTPKRDDGNVRLSIGDDVNPTGTDGSFDLGVKPGSYLLMVMKIGSPPMAAIPFEAPTSGKLDLGAITAKPGEMMPGPGNEDIDR